ncbi:aminoacyl-tRNA deacylase [Nocardioides pantholopis]|uniref:aminoacyl-tRNA deacylase n=1 Tax=Nocardioides pantholopis TaxID=2483798 RepID=UPI000FD8105B|nr:YbaK/EbsC family protein [Nocardioides pantholopis]
MDREPSDDTPALRALAAAGIQHTVTRHGRVRSLAEAAERRGVPPRAIVKTMVVRRGAGDHLFVLVPGDREISWPKLRALLGVNRMSMPDAEAAREVTGYERGTITPFGSATALPVVADERIVGRTISIGAGAHGVAATVAADDVIAHLHAQVADVTDPA